MAIGSVSNAYQSAYSSSAVSQSQRKSGRFTPEEFFQALPQTAQETIMKSIRHLPEEEQQAEIRVLSAYPFLNRYPAENGGNVDVLYFLSLPKGTREAVARSLSYLPEDEQWGGIAQLYHNAVSDMAIMMTRANCAFKSREYTDAYHSAAYTEISSNPEKYLQKYNDPAEFKAYIGRTIEGMELALAFDPSLEQRYLLIYQNIFDLLDQSGADSANNSGNSNDLSGSNNSSRNGGSGYDRAISSNRPFSVYA